MNTDNGTKKEKSEKIDELLNIQLMLKKRKQLDDFCKLINI